MFKIIIVAVGSDRLLVRIVVVVDTKQRPPDQHNKHNKDHTHTHTNRVHRCASFGCDRAFLFVLMVWVILGLTKREDKPKSPRNPP